MNHSKAMTFWLFISNTSAPVELKLAALAQAYGIGESENV